jgi:hypothetical protein
MGLRGTAGVSERTCEKGDNNLECCLKSYDGWMMGGGRTSPANGTENAIFDCPRNATRNKTRKNHFFSHPPTLSILKAKYIPVKRKWNDVTDSHILHVPCTVQPCRSRAQSANALLLASCITDQRPTTTKPCRRHA